MRFYYLTNVATSRIRNATYYVTSRKLQSNKLYVYLQCVWPRTNAVEVVLRALCSSIFSQMSLFILCVDAT